MDMTTVSTTDVGVRDVEIPDVTDNMKDVAQVAMLTPLGDPNAPPDLSGHSPCIWGAPICFWGLSGIAKTDRVKQAAQEAGLGVGVLMPGQRQPEDFAGVLVPIPGAKPEDKELVRSECMLGAVRYLNRYGRGVLFIDEVSTATPATQGSMLGMINDRQVGDVRMAPGIRILLASNPPEFSAGGWKLEPPMANRMCHVQVKCPSVDDWIAWLTSEGAPPPINTIHTEESVRNGWASNYARVKGQLVGFMHSNRSLLHMQPAPNVDQSGYNWPSPRSWWFAGRMRATAELLGKSEKVRDAVVEGCIGVGVYEAWMNWERKADLPPPEDALDGKWQVNPRRPDVCLAILTSTTQYIINIRSREEAIERAVQLWNLYNAFLKERMGDFTVPSARTLINKNLARRDDPRLKVAAQPVYQWMIDNKITEYAI